jgi:hypothetical protein
MKIKPKGTDKIKDVTPNEWSGIEKNGNSSEYEIIERNTIWAAPIDSNGEIAESQKREFELDHWHKLLDLGSKNKWRKVELNKSEIKEQNTENKVLKNTETDLKDESLELGNLQAELTLAQTNESKAKTELTIEQTKDLKRKWKYFFIGAILGNLKYIIEWLQSIFP